jgi:hypothetical protein
MGRLFGILLLACAIWVIYDVWTKNKRLTDTEKLVWTISAVLFSGLTAIIYFLTQKNRRN